MTTTTFQIESGSLAALAATGIARAFIWPAWAILGAVALLFSMWRPLALCGAIVGAVALTVTCPHIVFALALTVAFAVATYPRKAVR